MSDKKRPIEIVAEIGINWNGNVVNAENLINLAAECGADIAKFQLYDPRKRPDIDQHPCKDVLLKSRLTKRHLHHFKNACDNAGIEFMCSVFDVDKVEWLESLGVKRYKIGSKSFYDEELCEAVIATGKPILVSWGHYDPSKETPNFVFSINTYNMYCISKYPTELKDITDLRVDDIFGDNIYNSNLQGYSSHVEGITDAVVAMSRGATIIEKHITLDKQQEGPDHCFSLEPDELKQLCRMRDDIEKILYL